MIVLWVFGLFLKDIIIVVKEFVILVVFVIGLCFRLVIKVFIVVVRFGFVFSLNWMINVVRLRGKIIGELGVCVDIGVCILMF